MIGSIPDRRFDPPLGTLLETACPVCCLQIDRDEAVTCEDCFQRDGYGAGQMTVHPGCCIEADGCFWCFACVLKADTGIQVLGAQHNGNACPDRPSGTRGDGLRLAAMDGSAKTAQRRDAGSIPAASTKVLSVAGGGSCATALQPRFLQPLQPRDVTAHHIAQAIVAAALARDLRSNRI